MVEKNFKIKLYAGDNESKASTCSMDQIRAFVRQVKEKEDEIKGIREDIKQLTNDFVDEYGLPKKEVNVAIRMLKGDIDPDVVSEIYANIADLVS
jgi:uncharacterized protein (UPF0335 family)